MTDEKESGSKNFTWRDVLKAGGVVAAGLVLAWHAEKGSRVAAVTMTLIPFVLTVYYIHFLATNPGFKVKKPDDAEPKPRILMSIATGIIASFAIMFCGILLLDFLGIQ